MKRPENESSRDQQSPQSSDTATGSEPNAVTLVQNEKTAESKPLSAGQQQSEDSSQYAKSVRDLIRRVRKIVVPRAPLTPADSVADTVITGPFMQAAESLPAQIGRFRIERLLGRGGFGLVFVAYDPELDRHVALKIPRIEALAMSDGPARFLREARAAAMLGHPNIVPVFEAGNAGPSLYLTMELIHGPTLAQWIHGRVELPDRIACRSVARLVETLAFAVQHAHSRGIIHRDLKPANVLLQTGYPPEEGGVPSTPVTPEQLAEYARIADFGMAQMILADGLQTISGAVVGTPSYMAPEQIRASETPIRPATDVYGLGTILYELLTGQPPFTGVSFAGILKAVAEDPVKAPSRLNPHVPPDLEAICLKCLEKEPQQRYENAVLLADDLDRFVKGEPVKARRISLMSQCWRWARRNRMIAASLFFAFTSLLSGLSIAVYQARAAKRSLLQVEEQKTQVQQTLDRLKEQQEISEKNMLLAISQQRRAEKHLKRTEQAIDQLLNRVADELARVPHMTTLRTELLQQALQFESEIVQEESTDIDHQIRAAKAQGRVGEIKVKLGQIQEAQTSFQVALEQLDRINPESDGQRETLKFVRRTTILFLAQSLSQSGKFSDMEKLLEPLVRELSEEHRQHPESQFKRTTSIAHNLLARSQYRQNKFVEAEENFQESIQRLAEIPATEQTTADRTDLNTTHISLANLFWSRGDTARAVTEYEQSIEMIREMLKEHPDSVQFRSSLVVAVQNLAGLLIETADYDRAFELSQQIGPDVSRLLADYPEIALHRELKLNTLMTQATAYAESGGQPETALNFYREAISFAEESEIKLNGAASVVKNLARLHGNLGKFLHERADDDATAEVHFRKQVEIARRLTEEFPQDPRHQQLLSESLRGLLAFLRERGQSESAAESIQESERERDDAIPGKSPGR